MLSELLLGYFVPPATLLQSLCWETGNLGCICQPQAVKYSKVKKKLRGQPNLWLKNKYVGSFHLAFGLL